MERATMRCTLVLILGLFVAGSLFAADHDAAESRKGRWDFIGFTGVATSNSLDRTESGVKVDLDVDDAALVGIRGVAHLGDRVSFGLAYSFARPNFHVKATGFGMSATDRGDLSLSWLDADVTWHFLRRHSSPYVRGGVGLFNIAEKHVGDVFFAEQHFQYHAGVGYDWLIGEKLLLNFNVRAVATELDLWPDDLVFVEGTFGVGYRSKPRPRVSKYDPY